jgi:hypothetical protein
VPDRTGTREPESGCALARGTLSNKATIKDLEK